MKLSRYANSIAGAAMLAAFACSAAAPAAGNVLALTPEQAQYVRMHETAMAFVDSIAKTSDRYGPYQSVNLEQVRAILSLSEQAAQRRDYALASLQARAAYEVLRTSIMESVAKSQAATRPNAN